MKTGGHRYTILQRIPSPNRPVSKTLGLVTIEKSVFAYMHSFGPFSTISTENQWEITVVGRLSCFIEFLECEISKTLTEWISESVMDGRTDRGRC